MPRRHFALCRRATIADLSATTQVRDAALPGAEQLLAIIAVSVFDPTMRRSSDTTREIGFLLLPGFSLMSYASAVEPLRSASRLACAPLYRWHLFSPDCGTVQASNGLTVVPEARLEDAPPLDAFIVCAGLGVAEFHDARTFAALRRLARLGVDMGGISTGSLVLARAGLLAGYRCTIHWENLESFREEFPDLEVTGALYEIDRSRFTCAGGIAALDLMHELISRDQGRELSGAVSEQFAHTHVRLPDEPQRMGLRERLGVTNEKLLTVLRRMEDNLEEPLRRDELAAEVGISVRQLERLFCAYLGRTPGHHYLDLRLRRARLLLHQTSLPIVDVAVASGFVSASHFARAYREHFGHSPSFERPSSNLASRIRRQTNGEAPPGDISAPVRASGAREGRISPARFSDRAARQ